MLKLIPFRKGFLVAGIKIQVVWKWFPVSKFEYGRNHAGAHAEAYWQRVQGLKILDDKRSEL